MHKVLFAADPVCRLCAFRQALNLLQKILPV
jgi:hypothetical protein